MDRLSALDAAFLTAEDADPHVSMAIASVGVFDGPPPDMDELAEAFATRLPFVPRYRQRVRRAPFDLAPPVWVDDPSFDLRFHLRRTALPSPGGDAELFSLIARVMAARLDRDRPLWETWVVEGLTDERWALISKVHHCMVDGVAGTELYHLLLSATPDWPVDAPAPAPSETPPHPPTPAQLLGYAGTQGLGWPVRILELATSAVRHPRRAASVLGTTASGLVAMAHVATPVTTTSLNGPIGAQRRYTATTVPLADIKAIGRHYGVTVNDVALSAAAAGFRSLLLARGEVCGPDAVRSLVPVSVRPAGDEGALANKVSCMFADLPVHLEDPVERLREVHVQLVEAKYRHEAQAGQALAELSDRQPYAVLAPLLRTAFRLPQHNLVTVTTNVPGPRSPLFLMGREMRHLLPYVPIADGVRLGLAILSYCGDLAFGVTADYDTGADVRVVLDGIRHEIDTLRRGAKGERGRKASGNRARHSA